MGKIRNKLIIAFGSTIVVLLLGMVLNSQYLKKSAATHNALDLRIEPAVQILHDFDSYNKELFLLTLNKVATDQEGVITNRIKKITEVELPNLKTKTFKLISRFSLDNPNRLVFINLITLSDISIESVQEIYTLLKTKNDYKDLDKLRRATDILNNKLKIESNGIENAVATLQHDFNQERKSKRAELTMQLNNLSRIILITNTIGIMIGLFIAFNTIRSIVNRVQILKIGAKRISKGDYEHRVFLKGNDELTMLGNNFNEMAGSLSKSFENIKRKNKELEQFVYIASHDLQEPLRTIDSFSQLLSEQFDGKLNENGDQYIRFILKATSQMRCLVKDLMDYGRLGNDENLELVDCKSLVLGVKDELTELIKDSDSTLVINNLPNVQGYRTPLMLIFQNLINNALKFQKPDAKPRVEISHIESKNFWQFSVKDNGIGIPAEHKEKIFSIFKRLHSRSEYEGTGIGLAHCQKIVQMHGGKVWVTSAPEEGSTFFFTIAKKIIEERRITSR